ncbi:MAG: DUF5914 domain-containing protein [Sandaracinaceae bacterium]|nr:DUF5914 domain-containing protein [Sandaracinaceae bacterium]
MSERLWLIGRDPAMMRRADGSGADLPRNWLPDWRQADPKRIAAMLERALAKPTGGWVVLDAIRAIKERPRKYLVAGREVVTWWCGVPGKEGLRVADDFCPHMGAELSKGRIDEGGRILCPWHGLPVVGASSGRPANQLRVFDDGVLAWIQIPELCTERDPPSPCPKLPKRPARFLDATIRMEARCEARDVLANRLDPWHGVHFHPHSFARLYVVDEGPDHITVRVVYRIFGRLGIEVDARFDCPDARTIVMTIVAGEGIGSVVETHATPIDAGRTAIIEATLATSDRWSVISWLPLAGRWLRPIIQKRARMLWREDVDYCERIAQIRRRGFDMWSIDHGLQTTQRLNPEIGC